MPPPADPNTGHPLGLADQAAIEAALAPWRQALGPDTLSEYHFANLYLFRAVHRYRVLSGPVPAISGITYDGTRHALPLLPPEALNAGHLHTLLHWHDVVYPLPHTCQPGLGDAGLHWVAHEADADYLYDAEAFRRYASPALREKRRQASLLAENHAVVMRSLGADDLSAAQAVLHQWLADRQLPPDAADALPCQEALQLGATLGLSGWLWWVDGQAASFVLAQSLTPEVGVVRFAKAIDALPGLYPLMFQQLCQTHPAWRWVNFEQDLGHPGFRQSKRSYAPLRQLVKWRAGRTPSSAGSS